MRDRYASLRKGLVGAWIPSVSGSGLLLPDLSGNGNNGALTNMGPEDWVSGNYGRALDFDGSDDYVSVNSWASSGFGVADFSIGCWIKASSDSSTYRILGSRAGANLLGYQIYQDLVLGSYAYVFLTDNGPTVQAVYGGNVSTEWTHLIAARRNGLVRFFVNGLEIGTPYTESNSLNSAAPLQIGATLTQVFFDGLIDDVRAYNRALSESEIKLLASRPGIGLRPQRRTMYYAPPTGARRRRILTSMP